MDSDENVILDEIRTEEFKAAFNFFDKSNTKTINIQDLKQVFNMIGHYPSSSDLMQMIREVVEHKSEINEQEFLLLMSKRMKDVDTVEEVIEAFKYFDKEKSGLVHIEDMKKELLALGETMNEADLHEMLTYADEDNDGYINYEELVKKIVNS